MSSTDSSILHHFFHQLGLLPSGALFFNKIVEPIIITLLICIWSCQVSGLCILILQQEKAGGKEPLWDDVFSVLHQNAKKPETFIDNKSKKVVENYKKEMISRYGTDRENHPLFDGVAWCAAIEGVIKGRIYGAPGMPKSMISTSASSQSYMMESTRPSSSIHALKEQIKKRDGHILSLQQEMTSIKNFLSNMGYQSWASNMDQGMTTPMASSMPSHMAPQMYPLSNPVYRPRPRPLYIGPTS